ncbi:endonuclease domain-containing 1 protein-like [Channa argus]|uniref:endonuclease domain-containing 1 protein-like n=1 Tax=Channa argus TaxID=215402 RepID=UPI003522366E
MSMKTWCLLSLPVLLLLSIAPTEAEVVQPMSDCKGFLLDENTPQIPGILVDGEIQDQNRYKAICQTYNDERRFVTLYDTTNRIPVFSAYKYKGENKGTPRPSWKIEPQLEDPNGDKNMQGSELDHYEHQASNKDYDDEKDYDRGHLFPRSFAYSEDDKISTFTLTNIVPQAKNFNQVSWVNMEKCLRCILLRFCKNSNNIPEGYVVTGAQPGTGKLKERVNIPSVLWSAFCCYNNGRNRWIANSFWGNNVQASPDNKIHTSPLQDPIGNQQYEFFPGSQCPVDTTADQTIRQIKHNCPCPP